MQAMNNWCEAICHAVIHAVPPSAVCYVRTGGRIERMRIAAIMYLTNTSFEIIPFSDEMATWWITDVSVLTLTRERKTTLTLDFKLLSVGKHHGHFRQCDITFGCAHHYLLIISSAPTPQDMSCCARLTQTES